MRCLFIGLTALVILAISIVATMGIRARASQAAPAITRAAFYYPWYPDAWNQSGIDPYTNFSPSAGYYTSDDPNLIKEQIAAMQYGHLNAGIISWWGQGSQEDSAVPDDLAAADGTGFKWSLYYKPQGYSDPSVAQIQSDLGYIKANYASNPNFLTIDGKPVIFVYAGPDDGCAMAERWNQANATEGFYTVLKVFSDYTSCSSDASAWHQYAPSEPEDNQPGYSFSISPGFYQAGTAAPTLARNLATWAQNVKEMVASNEPLQLITTFNEWGEGTAVESATQWASASGYGSYLDVMHNEIPVSLISPGSGIAEQGYREVGSDGGVFAFGGAPFHGSQSGTKLVAPIVGMASDPATGGYWEVASDGGVFSFDAPFYGSTGDLHLAKPVVGMAAAPDGAGYWLVASDGGIFSFGDAVFQGSMGGQRLARPVVGIAVDPLTGGYWEVATDGGIFSFDAPFSGSTGAIHLNAPIVGMASEP